MWRYFAQKLRGIKRKEHLCQNAQTVIFFYLFFFCPAKFSCLSAVQFFYSLSFFFSLYVFSGPVGVHRWPAYRYRGRPESWREHVRGVEQPGRAEQPCSVALLSSHISTPARHPRAFTFPGRFPCQRQHIPHRTAVTCQHARWAFTVKLGIWLLAGFLHVWSWQRCQITDQCCLNY